MSNTETAPPTTRQLKQQGLSEAEICRRMGWSAGTMLVGDEGYGPTVILITAIGDKRILARSVEHNGKPARGYETTWVLDARDWIEATR